MHEVRKPSGFKLVCERTWASLAPTADPKIRHCDACGHAVHDCANTDEAAAISALGGCVALGEPAMKTVGNFGGGAEFPIVGWLVVTEGHSVGRVLELAAGTRTIGSAPNADLVITDPSVAPLHADVVGTAQGFMIAARGSAVVTVNGKPVAKSDLVDNDVIAIGTTLLRHKTIN